MGLESRVLKRRHLIYYLEVFNDQNGELLGHVVDITTHGLKLVSKQAIDQGLTFKLRMMLPEGYFNERELTFRARSLWSDNDINPDFFDTGFELTEPLDRVTLDILTNLIDQLGFND